MSEMPKQIELDVTQAVINQSNKLREAYCLGQVCPLAGAAKKIFKKNKFDFINVSSWGVLSVRNNEGKYFLYEPRAIRTVDSFIKDFDGKKKVKPAKFVFKLVKENV